MTEPEQSPFPSREELLRSCGICWRGTGGVRLHYCDLESGHKEDHKCHCGEILKKPTKLAGSRN
jgi:hypothetical protein